MVWVNRIIQCYLENMCLYIELFGKNVPMYGLMIMLGIVVANIIAGTVLVSKKLDCNDFIILEGYCLLGAFAGAKALYLIIPDSGIDWIKITQINYINQLMKGGFVFYGGLIGGLLAVLCAGQIHKINTKLYIRNFVFLIPLVHCFGRIGCFCAGCCYGIPYTGVGAVVFPEGSYAIAGISLFPVQLVEAGCLMCIAVIGGWMSLYKKWTYAFEAYLITYGIVRFVLEYFRYDNVRGIYYGLSISQWISVCMVVIGVLITCIRSRKLIRMENIANLH